MATTFITDQSSIALFNRGPITTTFTPPASCLSTLTWEGSMYFGHQGAGYFDTACFPSPTFTPALNAWDMYYYSPAQCPLGWAKATQLTSSFIGWVSTVSLSLGSATTAAVCCPSGYYYANNDHACQSVFTSTTTTLLYIDPVLSNNVWYSTNANTPSTTTVTAVGTYAIYGDGIPVWWQSSDLKLFSTPTGSSASTTTQIGPTPTILPTTSPSYHGLSSGAKIGIGLGIPLAVMAIGLVAFFIYFLRRRGDRVPKSELPAPLYKGPAQALAVQELHSNNESYNYRHSRGRHELPGRQEESSSA